MKRKGFDHARAIGLTIVAFAISLAAIGTISSHANIQEQAETQIETDR